MDDEIEPDPECWGDPALWREVCRRLCQFGAAPGRPPRVREPRSPRHPAQRLRGLREFLAMLRTRQLVDGLDLGWLMVSAGRFQIMVAETSVYYCPASGRIRVAGEPTRRARGLDALSRVLAELAGVPQEQPQTLAAIAARFVRKPD